MPNRSRAYVLSVIVSMGVFSIFRLAFYMRFRAIFDPFASSDVFSSFLLGLRYDLHIASVLVAFPYLLLHIPLPWSRMRRLAQALHWAPFPLLIVSAFLMTVDLYYYEEAGRRLSYEVFTLSNDLEETFAMMSHYSMGLVSFLAVCALVFLGWLAIARKVLVRGADPTFRRALAFLFLFLIAAGLSVRGSLGRCPLHLSHAFSLGATELGHLALNPVYTVSESYTGGQATIVRFLREEEALRNAQVLLGIDKGRLPDPAYPVFRAGEGSSARTVAPNFVVLILESFGSKHLGFQGADQDTTPNFDRLARQGLFFDDFYSVGVRTTEGLVAIVLGLPALNRADDRISVSALSGILTQNNYRGLAGILGEQGYRSVFMQGGKADSFRMIELARMTGFDRYMSEEDFDLAAVDKDSTWGAWDHVMLGKLRETIARMPEPFLAVWLSLSNHPPYSLPSSYTRRFAAGGRDQEHLDSIRYMDESLGRFFEAAAADPYFTRTVFVILADHPSRSIETLRDRFHIPLLVYGPGLVEPAVSNRVGSQVDVLPTILDLAGIKSPHHALGTSLLNGGTEGFAPINMVQGYGWVQDGRFLSLGPDDRLVSVYDYKDGRYLQGAEAGIQAPLSYFQVANNLLQENRLAPPRR